MRVLKVLLGSFCFLIVGTASALAAPVQIASDPFIEAPAVDGADVYYFQRSPDNAGYPISLHHYNLTTGTNTTIRSVSDHDVTVSDLRAGAGRVAFVESRINRSESKFDMHAVAINPTGTTSTDLFSWSFLIGDMGDPQGGLNVDFIRNNGEVLVRKRDIIVPSGQPHVTLIGVRRDGTSRKYMTYTGVTQLKFAYSNEFYARWTLRKLVYGRYGSSGPHGTETIAPKSALIFGASVDSAGRLLLSTFVSKAGKRNKLWLFGTAPAEDARVIKATNRRIPGGLFCGSRILIDSQETSGVGNQVVEVSPKGKVLRKLYKSPVVKGSPAVDGLTCDADTAAWRVFNNASTGTLTPYVLSAFRF